jgi:hypothetical protein
VNNKTTWMILTNEAFASLFHSLQAEINRIRLEHQDARDIINQQIQALSSKLSNTVVSAAQIQKRTDQEKETVKHPYDEGASKRSGDSARDSEDDPAEPPAVDDALLWLDSEIAAARRTQTAKDQPTVANEAVDELPEPPQTVASPARHTSDNQTVSPPLEDATTQANSSASSPLSACDDTSLAGNDNVYMLEARMKRRLRLTRRTKTSGR